jgi:hypothetical protein
MTIARSIVVQRIRLHLGDLPWETTGSALSDVSTVIVDDGEEWVKGNIGEFFDEGEVFYTRARDGDELTATRGYHGSSASSHSSGARILQDPRFRFSEITNAISSVIQTLPYPRVYKVDTDTITPDVPTTVWYALSDAALALVQVSQLHGETNENVNYYSRNRGHLGKRVIFESSVPATLGGFGAAVRFPDGFADDSNLVYIDFAMRITDTINTSLEYTDLNDGDALVEAIIFGAVALLSDSMELRKPRRPSPDTEYIQGGQLFEGRHRRALSHAERDIRAASPLLDTWKGPS